MPANWPVRSDYNSKWFTGAWAEAKVACGFDFKTLKKICSLGQSQSYKKNFVYGEDVQPHLVCLRIKGINKFEENSVYKCVFTC